MTKSIQQAVPQLVIEGLSRVVGGKTIVDRVSMVVATGEVVAITGSSGSGKSSLLRLINRLDEPTAGTVQLHGQDYRTIAPPELRRRVGMMMQSTYLFPGTVADNILFGPKQRGQSLPAAAIDQLLGKVGLAGFGDRGVGKLSGGEAQRVALARALANDPDILLLDEPTSALDDESKDAVELMLQEIIRAEQLTCLWVTHDKSQAVRMADRVALMEAGALIRIGTPQEVLHA